MLPDLEWEDFIWRSKIRAEKEWAHKHSHWRDPQTGFWYVLQIDREGNIKYPMGTPDEYKAPKFNWDFVNFFNGEGRTGYTYKCTYLNNKGETVPSTTKHYIIIGTSGAASKPRKHAGYGEAEVEARRLAAKHPSETFTIFESKSDFVLSSPVTKTTHY